MSAVNTTLTNFASVLKELYQGQKVQELGYKDLPLLAMIKKNEKLGGKLYPVPCAVSPSAGVSPSFALAQSNQAPAKFIEFQITTSDIYSLATVDNKVAQAAKNDNQSFVNAIKSAHDSAIDAASKYLALSLYRTNGGGLGVISSITTGVITLTNRGDACNFEYGQCLNFSTDGTTANVLVTGTGGTTIDTAYVIAVDRSAGTVTIANTYGGSAASPAGSYIYNTSNAHTVQAGDHLTLDGVLTGTATNNMFGLQSWLPSTAPTASTFFGVDRTIDRQRLAGTYYDGSSKLVTEAIGNGLTLIAEAGGRPSHVFLPFASYQAAVNEISQKATVNYESIKGRDIDVSFEGVKIHGPRGPVTLVPDFACPAASAFALDMDHWFLGSIDKAPAVLDSDGMPMLRVYNQDAIETRVGSYAQIYTDKPVSSGQITLSV